MKPPSDGWNCIVQAARKQPLRHANGALRHTRFAVKANIAVKDHLTTCGSEILSNYTSPYTATCVKRLLDSGSEFLGITNMDEFGMGLSLTALVHGPVVNPLYRHQKHISGGSSGGSAAAVSAGLCDFALGTDTGGSVRQPASYCGVVGFKPTYGRISRFGVVPYAQTLDTVGILAGSIEMARKVFAVLDAHDENDITSMGERTRQKTSIESKENYEKSQESALSLVIGIPQEFLLQDISEAMMSEFQAVVELLMDNGHAVVPVSIPLVSHALSAYYTLATAEAASNLARYDGIRYGKLRPEGAKSIPQLIAQTRSAGFGPEAQRRIVLGNFALSSESHGHYGRATQIRRNLAIEINGVFKRENPLTGSAFAGPCHVLLSPSALGCAPSFQQYEEETTANFLNGYANDILTVPASLAGIPAVSVPARDKRFGVQVMGQFGDDDVVLKVAQMIEKLVGEARECT